MSVYKYINLKGHFSKGGNGLFEGESVDNASYKNQPHEKEVNPTTLWLTSLYEGVRELFSAFFHTI